MTTDYIMQMTEGPRRGIYDIISQCSNKELFQEQARYFMRKSYEMKQCQSKFDSSIRRLKTLDNDESEEEMNIPIAEMAETFYAQHSQPKLLPARLLMDSPDKNNKNKFHSLPSEQLKPHLAPSHRSLRSPIPHANSKSQPRTNLPNLLSKMRKGKLPTNASRNNQIAYERVREGKAQGDLTYDMIRLQRRKLEETRHFLVLGRVYDENYRKDLKSLWALKRKRKVKI